MIFIIGGYAQGKLDYVKKTYGVAEEQVWSGCMPEIAEGAVSSGEGILTKGIVPTGEVVQSGGTASAREEVSSDGSVSAKRIVIADFNRMAEAAIRQRKDASNLVKRLIERYPDCIIISDEIGNGIVPVDAWERRLREEIGRLQIQIAGQADEVVRVVCGLGQRIK